MESKNSYQICTKCVMDTSDPKIIFDENGICDHCNSYDTNVKPFWFPNDYGKELFAQQAEKIKQKGKGKEFDSIIGLSGGLDSSYLLQMSVKQ